MAEPSEPESRPTYLEEHASSSPKSSPRRRAANKSMNCQGVEEGAGDNNSVSGPSPSKMSPRSRSAARADTSMENKTGDSLNLSTAVISPKHKDPDRIKKDREREERVRQARERLEEERKKKLVELQEQQRQAQENRDKQMELRRKKIEELRRREGERRAEVERRRREKENAERSRRETLLLKAEERVARYEAWKRGGQKGGRGHVLGFGSATPRDICIPFERPRRSSSHSALVRHSPNGSDSDYSFRPQRRAVSACSTVRRHCCVDLNRTGPPPGGAMPTKHLSVSTSVLYRKRNSEFSSSGTLNMPTRPDSLLALNTIPEGRRSVLAPSAPPHRPRSVMTLNTSSSASPSGGGVRLRENKSPRKPRPASVGPPMPSFVNAESSKPSSRSKSTDRLARDRSRPRVSTPGSKTVENEEDKKTPDKPGVRMSRKTLDRLSTPRQVPSGDGDRKEATSTPRRENTITRKPSLRDKTPKETPPKPLQQTTPVAATSSSTPVSTKPSTSGASTPTTPSRTPSRTPVRVLSPSPGADEDGGSQTPPSQSTPTPMERSSADITAEEYKAKLAEKRRQAREKAEREAEEERKRQEEQEREEEERRLKEEEEQRLRDEEALRFAEEARLAEEERLQKAIEAEEARKAEEAARLEQERLAKEEADRKAKEEAERVEKERQEKARKDEEERLERKKRLDMIMKRVKTNNAGENVKDSPKSVNSSPTKSVTSSDASPSEPDNKTVVTTISSSDESELRRKSLDNVLQETAGSQSPASGTMSPANAPSPVPFAPQEVVSDQPPPPSQEEDTELVKKSDLTPAPTKESIIVSSPLSRFDTPDSTPEKPKFKSPLLQKLMEGKDDAGSSPGGGSRFKSPILQNVLNKTKVGARMGYSPDHSVSSPDLSQMDRSADEQNGGNRSVSRDAMSSSLIDIGTGDSLLKEDINRNDEKDVDTSEDSQSSSNSSPSHVSKTTVVSNGDDGCSSVLSSEFSPEDSGSRPEPMDISGSMGSSGAPSVMATSAWSGQDSGVVIGSEDRSPDPSLESSLNGHSTQTQGLKESSFGESVTSLVTDSATGSITSSFSGQSQGQSHSSGDRDFEELIDLSISNKSSTLLDTSADLVNFNKREDESDETINMPPPIIAFEESNMTRRQDVPDLMS